jgi:prephenate dehydratase
MKVAFQGVPGAYSEMAARVLFGPRCRTLPCETFPEVFAAVAEGRADRGMLPVENSMAGSIHQNYDLLREHGLPIVAEWHFRVEHCLMALPGIRLSALRKVRSHPQALAQCDLFFRKSPRIKAEVFFDTAGAAKSLAENSDEAQFTGAIASRWAAELYGLEILREAFQDSRRNVTRFVAVSRKAPPAPREGVPAKTSLCWVPKTTKSGTLHRLLGIFASRNIDLLKIESRPDPGTFFRYRFYLDLAGSLRSPAVAEALTEVRSESESLWVLGSYAAAPSPFASSSITPTSSKTAASLSPSRSSSSSSRKKS